MKLLPILTIACLVTGCAFHRSVLKPLDATATIRGKEAAKTEISVTSPIIWRYANPPSYEELCQLPTGTYIAEGTDGRYIYYRAPKPVSYTLQLSHYARDRKKRKGTGGIYLKLNGSRSIVGAYLKTENGVERLLEGFDSFFKEEGKSWTLKDK